METPICHYCFIDLRWERGDHVGLDKGTLDRIDNDKNYSLDNVVAACYGCNMMRNDMRQEEFYDFIYNMAKRTKTDIHEPKDIRMSNYGKRKSEELIKKQNGRCYLSGIPFRYERGPYYPSADRIDSTIGYKDDNVAICLTPFNRMKNVYTKEEAIAKIEYYFSLSDERRITST